MLTRVLFVQIGTFACYHPRAGANHRHQDAQDQYPGPRQQHEAPSIPLLLRSVLTTTIAPFCASLDMFVCVSYFSHVAVVLFLLAF